MYFLYLQSSESRRITLVDSRPEYIYEFKPLIPEMMAKVRRVLVYLSKENSLPRCVEFVQRPSFCPFKHLSVSEASMLPLDILDRGVDVGVAVLLQSANQKVLLTRRASSLAIFPNVWVPPGGHLELDEKLLDAGLRELREETGISLKPEEFSSHMLGLWESVFPPMLSRGLPRRHHIVTYLLLQSTQTHLQLQDRLCPEPREVSGCVWVDPSLIRAIVSTVDGAEHSGKAPANLPQTVRVTEVCSDGALLTSELPVSVLLNTAPPEGPDVERISTGTKYALELWLKAMETGPDSTSTQQ
ncbi:nucleoside diphosphate-linked moiety X motif 17-like isoform X4 [Acipenser ruthenus]|uniref:nucleoside diphosphate-linked moiety X motif 17-like isoform X4 n=1 Tax=Acipenser ruthenus TaxID=7906 RepID=UPI002741C1F6|nr:nucleoside diphosphate-linked moiety X motif 17-like isoform X4 [Acipenser ruthenus]